MKVARVSWAEVGHVERAGRYMFKFGWLTISEDDLAVWRNYPEASFALYEPAGQGGEYRLGSFDMPITRPPLASEEEAKPLSAPQQENEPAADDENAELAADQQGPGCTGERDALQN